MENSTNIMRIALIISIMLHVLFMVFSGHDLRATTHGEVMNVDIVPANEAPAAHRGDREPETKTLPIQIPKWLRSKPETQVSERSARNHPPSRRPPGTEPTSQAKHLPLQTTSPKAKESAPKSIKQDTPRTNDPKPAQALPDQIGNESQSPASKP